MIDIHVPRIIPPPLAERLAELDRFIEANEATIEDAEAQIKDAEAQIMKYRLTKAEVENAIALCREAWCTTYDEATRIAPYRPGAHKAEVTQPAEMLYTNAPRQRRDMREVVRQILRGWPDGSTVGHIAAAASLDGRKVRESEIRNALTRMDGEVEQMEMPEGMRWRLAVGPAGAAPRQQQPFDGDSQMLLKRYLVHGPAPFPGPAVELEAKPSEPEGEP